MKSNRTSIPIGTGWSKASVLISVLLIAGGVSLATRRTISKRKETKSTRIAAIMREVVQKKTADAYDTLPLNFESNRGQADLAVQQASSQPSPQAISILQQSVVAMGGTTPSDSTATGSITIVAGSLTENGTIEILTRGTEQSSEEIQTDKSETVVYSYGQASRTVEGSLTELPMEQALTSQSPDFPLPLLVNALSNPDESYKYVGKETLNSASVQHMQMWSSFASVPAFQPLANCSIYDIWVDSSTYLPVKISFKNWWGRGATPRPQYDVFFSNYEKVGGVLYPFSIKKSLDSTPWETITIGNVAFNTGLIDSDFPVQ